MPLPSPAAWTGERATVVAGAPRSTNGDSGPLRSYGPASSIRAQLNVTAASGTTPTLDVLIEDSVDDGVTWNTIGTFAQKTAAAREVINVTVPFGDVVRVRWTIGGSAGPTFTFAVDWVAQSPSA